MKQEPKREEEKEKLHSENCSNDFYYYDDDNDDHGEKNNKQVTQKKKNSMTAEMSLCQLFQSLSPTCTTAFVFCWVKKRVKESQKQRNKRTKQSVRL